MSSGSGSLKMLENIYNSIRVNVIVWTCGIRLDRCSLFNLPGLLDRRETTTTNTKAWPPTSTSLGSMRVVVGNNMNPGTRQVLSSSCRSLSSVLALVGQNCRLQWYKRDLIWCYIDLAGLLMAIQSRQKLSVISYLPLLGQYSTWYSNCQNSLSQSCEKTWWLIFAGGESDAGREPKIEDTTLILSPTHQVNTAFILFCIRNVL